MDTLFAEIAIVLITAGVLALIFNFFRQPLIVAYIATGLLTGPAIFGVLNNADVFQVMSEIGIAFLLFLVGLQLNWNHIKDIGKAAFFVGVGQVFFTSIFGYFIGLALGLDHLVSLFIGVGFAFSSTIVMVKLLDDKNDLDRLYGRISVGVLIVQDLIAIFILLMVATFLQGNGTWQTILLGSSGKLALVLLALYVLSKYILPVIFSYSAGNKEMLFLLAIVWCFAAASALYILGFGLEIGALLAGVSLAGSQFQREIDRKIKPLRDFFIIIFFIVLGSHLTFDSVAEVWPESLILSAFILIGNPVIVILIMRFLKYRPRLGFLVGVTMAQISEFSFILMALATGSGIIPMGALTLTTLAGIITILISTYLIKYNEQIYEKIKWMFRFLEVRETREAINQPDLYDVILIGFEQLGEAILPGIKRLRVPYLVLDFNPQIINHLYNIGAPCQYGDAGNEDLLQTIAAEKAKIIISTSPDIAVNLDLLAYLKRKHAKAVTVVTAKTAVQARRLYQSGATYVLLPNFLGGEVFGEFLSKKMYKKTAWRVAVNKQIKLLEKN